MAIAGDALIGHVLNTGAATRIAQNSWLGSPSPAKLRQIDLFPEFRSVSIEGNG